MTFLKYQLDQKYLLETTFKDKNQRKPSTRNHENCHTNVLKNSIQYC